MTSLNWSASSKDGIKHYSGIAKFATRAYRFTTICLAVSALLLISLLSSPLTAQDNLRKAFDSPAFNAKP
jgi:hypothetical protein